MGLDNRIYPGEVDFDYKVRCDKHNFKPYDYCEMCMIRTELQKVKEEAYRNVRSMLSQTHLAISVLNDIAEKHQKQIDEIKILIGLIKEK